MNENLKLALESPPPPGASPVQASPENLPDPRDNFFRKDTTKPNSKNPIAGILNGKLKDPKQDEAQQEKVRKTQALRPLG